MKYLQCYWRVAVLVVACSIPASFALGGDTEAGGWFGVRLDAPCLSLEKQLGLDGKGLVVFNVCEGSPADTAGLQQFDLLIKFDGQEVGNEAYQLGERIREIGSGTEVVLIVIRGGQETPLQVKLGAFPDKEGIVWKYKEEPKQVFKENYSIHGKVLEHSPGGELVIKDIGKLEEIPELFRQVLPDYHEAIVEFSVDDGKLKKKVSVVKEGETIEVEQEHEGEILVRRIVLGEDEHEAQVVVYEDNEALKEGDQEAYYIAVKIHSDARLEVPGLPDGPKFVVETSSGAPRYPHLKQEHRHLILEDQERVDKEQELKVVLEQAMLLAQEKTRKILQDKMERVEKFQEEMADVEVLAREIEERVRKVIEEQLQARNQAQFDFKQEDDGRLTVTIRKGDSELSMVFDNEDQLKEKSPKLYDRYVELKSSD